MYIIYDLICICIASTNELTLKCKIMIEIIEILTLISRNS